MMPIPNEIVFFAQIFIVSLGSLITLRIGYGAIAAYVALLGILSNLLVCKEVVLFGFTVTASDSLAVGLILGLNLIQEWFGKKAAQKTIKINFILLFIYLLLTQIHLWHIPAAHDINHQHYKAIFDFMPRLTLASIASYFIVQITDSVLYRKLSSLCYERFFAIRNFFSLCVSELLDTLLFSFLGLYGSVSSITNIIIFSYIVKLLSILCFLPLVIFIKKLVPKNANKNLQI